MPLYKATSATFDGKTAATGLFDPGANTGANAIQVRINGLFFSAGAITSWTLSAVDPLGGTETILLAGTLGQLAAGGPSGFMILPTDQGGVPWRLAFIAAGLDAPATLTIDYDFMETEA